MRIGAVAAALGLAGCTELPPQGKTQLAAAEKAYRANDLPGATKTLDAIIREYPQINETALAYYLRALCHEKNNRLAEAGQDAQKCIALSADRNLTAKARAMCGALYFDMGNTEAAIEQYAKAVDLLPEKPPTDMVRYRYGVCLQRGGDWKAAKKQFRLVCEKYPGSQAAPWARRLAEWPHACFSIQCGVYRDRNSAQTMMGRLSGARLSPWMDTQSRDGNTVNVVYSGRFATYEQAKSGLTSVRRIAPDASVAP